MLPTELRLCNFQQFNTFPKRQILDSSRLREFADDNSKFDENRGKFSNRFENVRGKAEIAHYEQFPPFPIEFTIDLYCKHVKTRACSQKVNLFPEGKGLDWSKFKSIAD